MEEIKKSKWLLPVAIEVGKKSVYLSNTYIAEIGNRFREGELEQHEANSSELEERQSGQKVVLSNQKSNTAGQNDIINRIKETLIGIHNVVQSSSPPADIKISYGIGLRIKLIITSVVAGANIVKKAYEDHKEWSNKAGIIDADIENIDSLLKLLRTAEDSQDESMYVRKSKTMTKDVLHRAVEDGATKISAIGAFVFHESKPGVAKLFKELIPVSHRKKK